MPAADTGMEWMCADRFGGLDLQCPRRTMGTSDEGGDETNGASHRPGTPHPFRRAVPHAFASADVLAEIVQRDGSLHRSRVLPPVGGAALRGRVMLHRKPERMASAPPRARRQHDPSVPSPNHDRGRAPRVRTLAGKRRGGSHRVRGCVCGNVFGQSRGHLRVDGRRPTSGSFRGGGASWTSTSRVTGRVGGRADYVRSHPGSGSLDAPT